MHTLVSVRSKALLLKAVLCTVQSWRLQWPKHLCWCWVAYRSRFKVSHIVEGKVDNSHAPSWLDKTFRAHMIFHLGLPWYVYVMQVLLRCQGHPARSFGGRLSSLLAVGQRISASLSFMDIVTELYGVVVMLIQREMHHRILQSTNPRILLHTRVFAWVAVSQQELGREGSLHLAGLFPA